MPKWFVLSIGDHNHDPRTQPKPLEPKQLTLGDHGLRNIR